MCVFFPAIILVIELLINRNIYRKWITPPVILDIMWLGVHVLNLILGWQLDALEYLILILPPLMFDVGFYFSYRHKYGFSFGKKSHYRGIKNDLMTLGCSFQLTRWFYFFFYINMIIFAIQIISSSRTILAMRMDNIWQNIHQYNNEVSLSGNSNIIMTYSVPACYIFSGFCAINYFKRKNLRNLIYYCASLFIAIFRAFLAGNRTSLFMVICINAFSLITLFNVQYPKYRAKVSIRRIAIVAGTSALLMFLYIARMKYNQDFEKMTINEFIANNLSGYYNLSSAAFVEWYRSEYKGLRLHGQNTFRFIFAVLARFGFNMNVVNTTSASSYVYFREYTTNALTVAMTYIQDFGVLFMAIMLMIFGTIHGLFYRKAFITAGVKKYFYIIMNGALYLGVVYQVLTDQYMNIFSMWLSFAIWSYVFSKTCIKEG